MKKILLVDNQPLLQKGLETLIAAEPGLTVCGMAGTAKKAISLVESTKPDLVITELTLPDRNGLELIKDLVAIHSELPIIALSMHDELIYAERVLRSGGRAYVMKNAPTDRLIEAIRTVMDGGVFASRTVTDHLLKALSTVNGEAFHESPFERLTDREIEVFDLIGQAKSNHDIASNLGISPRTVDAHRAHIRKKLGLGDGNELTRYAIRRVESGLIGA